MSPETNEQWRWFLVITDSGDVSEAFNSLPGAEGWQEEHGGIIIKVKEEK